MAEVYWIHLPEHTDMFSQGYIGFTSKTAKHRFNVHKSTVNTLTNGCEILKNVIRKYGEKLVLSTLCICSNTYGLDLERKLRPSPNIGWNIAAGGGAPMLGRKLSEKSRAKQVASCKKTVTIEEMRARAAHMIKTPATREVLSAAQQKIAPLRSLYRGQRVDPYVWVNAEVFLAAYKRGIRKKTVEKALGAPSKKYNTLWKAFEEGWSPIEDKEWIVYHNAHEDYFDLQLNGILLELGTPLEQLYKNRHKKVINGT